MQEPVLKTGKRYILFRWVLGIGLVLFFAFVIVFMILLISASNFSTLLFFLVIVIGIPTTWLYISVLIFNLDYSLLGRFQRTPWPEETPLATYQRFTRGLPFRGWSSCVIFPSGLGLELWPVGKVFIPRKQMLSLTPSSIMTLGRYELNHNSPELLSPVYFLNKELYRSLEALMKTKPV